MPEQTAVDPSHRERTRKRGAEVVLRGLSGALAAALVLLALVVIGAGALAIWRQYPGPGTVELGGHGLAAVLAVLSQRFADRHRGPRSALAALGVIALAGATLWLWWWR
jgi:hypothetical protein